MFLGQHSLQVFAAHIALVYALELTFSGEKPAQLLANLLILLTPAPPLCRGLGACVSIEHAKRTGRGLGDDGWADFDANHMI